MKSKAAAIITFMLLGLFATASAHAGGNRHHGNNRPQVSFAIGWSGGNAAYALSVNSGNHYRHQRRVYQRPRPVYHQPRRVYQHSRPVYHQPRRVYQRPRPVYHQPRRVYQHPRPVVYVQSAPVVRYQNNNSRYWAQKRQQQQQRHQHCISRTHRHTAQCGC
ncbi:MAG: hypothetical protein KDI44_13385 [Thiothrix sp.]|nr:hypothetical protein [Thiothrix sp.]